MIVLREGAAVPFVATGATRAMLLGGSPIDGERLVWWNFVASSQDLLAQAKADWKAGRFARIPGETEFIPLPEG
jgi:hypothetical protein